MLLRDRQWRRLGRTTETDSIDMAMNEKLTAILDEFSAHEVRRIILSAPADKTNRCRRLTIRRIPKGFLLEKVVGVQAFQETLTPEAVMSCVHERLGTEYRQFNGWNELGELCISAGADGGFTCRRKKPQAADPAGAALHNRVKKHLLAEHDAIPPLIDMGVFTKDGRLVTSMADKYRQINRFLEFIEDVIGDEYRGKRLNAIDFGCGKSYLTFIMYHYLTVIKGVDAHMIGLDLKADVIQHCNDAARKYGYDGLSFQVGDISGYETGEAVDLVVTLHACDTATDHAMAHAVKWGARTILSVPCCQHELNGQMHSERLPVLCCTANGFPCCADTALSRSAWRR